MEDKTIEQLLNVLNLRLSPKVLEEKLRLRVSDDGSPPVLGTRGVQEQDLLALTLDRQITVRPRISEFSRREQALLLEVLNFQVVHYGINFSMYLTMEYLVSSLLGKNLDPLEIRDEKERLTVSVSELILLDFYGQFIPMAEDLASLDEELRQAILANNLVMSRRTYGSRLAHYRPERYFEIRSVVLESIYERRKGSSSRYSSYTKGYGESHPSARKVKTKPSAELDGQTEDKELSISLIDISKYLVINQLKLLKKQRNSRKRKQ